MDRDMIKRVILFSISCYFLLFGFSAFGQSASEKIPAQPDLCTSLNSYLDNLRGSSLIEMSIELARSIYETPEKCQAAQAKCLKELINYFEKSSEDNSAFKIEGAIVAITIQRHKVAEINRKVLEKARKEDETDPLDFTKKFTELVNQKKVMSYLDGIPFRFLKADFEKKTEEKFLALSLIDGLINDIISNKKDVNQDSFSFTRAELNGMLKKEKDERVMSEIKRMLKKIKKVDG